jgi:hypothetical protein
LHDQRLIVGGKAERLFAGMERCHTRVAAMETAGLYRRSPGRNCRTGSKSNFFASLGNAGFGDQTESHSGIELLLFVLLFGRTLAAHLFRAARYLVQCVLVKFQFFIVLLAVSEKSVL